VVDAEAFFCVEADADPPRESADDGFCASPGAGVAMWGKYSRGIIEPGEEFGADEGVPRMAPMRATVLFEGTGVGGRG